MSVFLSFDQRDAAKAGEIVGACRAAGIAIWQPGSGDERNFVLLRRAAISSAEVFVAVLSPRYAGSVLCVNELKLARRSGVRRIAVVVGADPAVEALIGEAGFQVVKRADEPVAAIVDDLRRLGVAGGEQPTLNAGATPAGLPQASAAPTPFARPGPRPDAKQFFINFAGEDRDPVAYLRGALKEQSIPFWDFQQGDRNLQTPLANEIEDAIQASVGMLSIVTNRWRDSQWVLREYLFAREVGLPTFLLLFEKIKPTLVISERTFIDFTADRGAGVQQLAREVAEIRTV
jgi:hypothetical protein